MNVETMIVTTVVTLIVLTIACVAMVLNYKRAHYNELRQGLMKQARKRGIASPEDLSNQDLALQIHAVKLAEKHSKVEPV